MPSKWDFYSVRRWSLYFGGLLGVMIVGGADLIYNREVNPAVYVLIAGMLGLPDVLFRQDQLRGFQPKDKEATPPKKEEP